MALMGAAARMCVGMAAGAVEGQRSRPDGTIGVESLWDRPPLAARPPATLTPGSPTCRV
jgi:hypothetical protein